MLYVNHLLTSLSYDLYSVLDTQKAVKNTFQFVVGSLLCSERFSSGYSSFQKPTLPNSNSTRNQVDEDDFVDLLPLNHYLFILFITCTFKVEEN